MAITFDDLPDASAKPRITFDDLPLAQQPGFFGRIGASVDKNNQQASMALKDAMDGKTNPIYGALGIASAGAKNATAVPAELISTAYDSLPTTDAFSLARTANKVANTVSNARQRLSGSLNETGLGQAIGNYLMDSPNAADFMNRTKQAAMDAGTVASVIPLGKVATSVTAPAVKATGTGLEKVGDAIYKSGVNSAAAKRGEFLQDLITPKMTPTLANERFANSVEKGMLKKAVYQPNAFELEIAETVGSLPVKPSNSLLKNYNIIRATNDFEAQKLLSKLKQNDVPVGMDDLELTIGNSLGKLKDNPVIVGDAEQTASKVVSGLKKAIADTATDGKITASSLLEARRNFDKWVLAQKSEKTVFGDRDSALSISVNQLRNDLNTLIENTVPNAGYKQSLRKQSNLYRAMEAIESKGGAEGKDAFQRIKAAVGEKLPGRTGLEKTLATTAIGGGTAIFPVIPAVGLGAYAAGKAVASPVLRKALGSALGGTGKIIKSLPK